MIPLNLARLAAAGLFAGLSGIAGLVLAPPRPPAAFPASSSDIRVPATVRQADIGALSARLHATGLFPAALPLNSELSSDTPSGDESPGGAAEDDAGGVPPPINALVREEGVWRLHAGTVISDRTRLREGDELFDGWEIAEIGATHIVLMREGEMRTVYVFEFPGDG